MDTGAIMALLWRGNQLKRTPRTGWTQRGVAQAESVAGHSFGVVFVAMVLAELLPQPVDLARVLAMAALHDLPEGLTGDIPTPAWRFLPAGMKADVERAAMQESLAGAPFRESWLATWEELNAGITLEARLVHDADKLDMYLQALAYEQQSGNRWLQEFWDGAAPFHLAPAQAIFAALQAQRAAN